MIRVTAQADGANVVVGFMDPLDKPDKFVWVTLTRDEADELRQEVSRVLDLTEPQ